MMGSKKHKEGEKGDNVLNDEWFKFDFAFKPPFFKPGLVDIERIVHFGR